MTDNKTNGKRIYEYYTKANLKNACMDFDFQTNGRFEKFCENNAVKYLSNDWRPKLVHESTSEIVDYTFYETIYYGKILDILNEKYGVDKMFMKFGGNRVFFIAVPKAYNHDREFFCIHGIKRALLVAHVISMDLDGDDTIIYTKDYHAITSISCKKDIKDPNDYSIKIYADSYDPESIDTFNDCFQTLSNIANKIYIKYGDDEIAKDIDNVSNRIKILLNNNNIEIVTYDNDRKDNDNENKK